MANLAICRKAAFVTMTRAMMADETELVERLREALKPFASAAAIHDQLTPDAPDDTPCREFFPGIWPTLGDCRKARAALSGEAS